MKIYHSATLVARVGIFLLSHYVYLPIKKLNPMTKNIPNSHKIYQMALKYTKWL
jgi:hypothetical protein